MIIDPTEREETLYFGHAGAEAARKAEAKSETCAFLCLVLSALVLTVTADYWRGRAAEIEANDGCDREQEGSPQ